MPSSARIPAPCTEAGRGDRDAHVVFAGERSGTPEPRAVDLRPVPRRAASTAPLDPASRALCDEICRRAGIDPARYRPEIFRRRLAACLRALHARSPVDARLALARCAGAANDRALGALLIGVTSFFRDSETFAALERRIPELARRSPHGRVRALSVGCSDGQELLSIAILLAEHGALPDPGELHGIDCRPTAIETARAGEYASPRGLSAPRAATWFEPCRAGYRAIDALRVACRWTCNDAFTRELTREHDLVACRNVAIYLTFDASQQLWSELARRVRAGGLLVTGKAERPPADLFAAIGPSLFERRGGAR